MTTPPPSYDLFISYSHAADAGLAIALESALQSFGRTALERRRIAVFRDESQLSLAPDLWGRIEAALRVSRCFLFLASEQAARSNWVTRELECWKSMHHAERLFIAWTDGMLRWRAEASDFDWSTTTSVPQVLAGVFSGEPLHLDLRWARATEERERESGRFLRDVARIVAAIWERPVEDVYGEELRRHRETLARESTLLSERIRADYQADPERAVLLALAAMNSYVTTPRAELALNTALDASRLRNSWACRMNHSLAIAPDGARILVIGERVAQVLDLTTSTLGPERQLPAGHVMQVVYRPGAVLLSIRGEDGGYTVFDALSGETVWTFDRSHTDLISLSDDGSLIAIARTHRGQDRAAVDVLETGTFTPRACITGYPEGLVTVDFAAAGERLVTRAYEAFTHIWDVRTGKSLADYQEPSSDLVDLEISPDGATLAVYVAGASYVRVVDALSGHQRGTLSEHRGGTGGVTFARRIALIATSDRDGTVRAFDSTTLAPQWKVQAGKGASVRGVSADGAQVLTSAPGVVAVWDARTGARALELRPHPQLTSNAHFAHDDGVIVTSSDGRLRLWTARPSPAAHWDAAICEDARGSIDDMAIDSRGTVLLITHTTGAMWLLNAETGAALWKNKIGRREALLWVDFSPEDALLMTGGTRNVVRLWDPITGEPAGQLEGHDGAVDSIAFDVAGKRVAGAGPFTWGSSDSKDRTVSVWDWSTRTLVHTLHAPAAVSRAVFSPDGSRVAAPAADHHVAVWEIASGELLSFERHEDQVRGAKFTSDNRLLIASGGNVLVKDGRSGALIRVLTDPSRAASHRSVGDLVISQDSRFAAAADDQATYVWDLDAGTLLFVIPGYVSGGLAKDRIRFDPSGDHIIVGHRDEFSIWSTANGQPTRSLPVDGLAGPIAIDGAGRFIVAADLVRVRRWNTHSGDGLQRFARTRVFRDLTDAERQAYGLP